ncbi:biotin synthase [Bombella sp. TMW 2.2559]|uniref:Biotin synthase n=1 Tax=Bombella dulcis TaxID=2967339 RepID=A0ABT3WCW4_9PROT|nr:biotin synthase [Bombella dulcis]MCX5616914.1 biotin synthase [Bombella dulcis]
MTILYFQHGWGYDASFWTPLRNHLRDFQHVCGEAGYFGAEARSDLPQDPFWAVGHSAGACSLLALDAPHCLGLISINGFARFTRTENFPEGVPERILHRMIRQLDRQPEPVLHQFRQMCGEADPALPATLDHDALKAGLSALAAMEHRPLLSRWKGRLHSLHSPDDPLSPARNGLGLDAASISLPGGHLLPCTHPQDCAALLTRIIRNTSAV